jgi:putative endonuclease
VDIVARDGATTVFVEVKERRGSSHGEGFEAVTNSKRQRIVGAARIYASSHGLTESPLRFDVVSIDWTAGTPQIRHDKDAFSTG